MVLIYLFVPAILVWGTGLVSATTAFPSNKGGVLPLLRKIPQGGGDQQQDDERPGVWWSRLRTRTKYGTRVFKSLSGYTRSETRNNIVFVTKVPENVSSLRVEILLLDSPAAHKKLHVHIMDSLNPLEPKTLLEIPLKEENAEEQDHGIELVKPRARYYPKAHMLAIIVEK